MTATAPAFEFKTKAQNLRRLVGVLRHALICEIEIATVAEWRNDPGAVVRSIQNRFGATDIIVRSSTTDEDTSAASMAGAFESVANVQAGNADAVREALELVVRSYLEKGVAQPEAQEILVQPMVPNVVLSGVLFTRDLERNLPYLVINYEESERTDSITGGTTSALQRTYRIFKGADPSTLAFPLNVIVEAATELESVTSNSALDIEFAIDASGALYLLQVRQLIRTQVVSHNVVDRRLANQIAAMKDLIATRMERQPSLFGSTTVLGEMPDWNPAEIIGTHPTALASSLYRFVIMNAVWREARGLLGYRDPVGHQLLISVAGRPYVDVRNSANSLIPGSVSADLGERLVDHYLRRLEQHPEFHDKIEFEIFVTCLHFDSDSEEDRLRSDGFSEADLAELRQGLFDITNHAVTDTPRRRARFEADVAELRHRRSLIGDNHPITAGPSVVQHLLEDCRRFGTLSFSVAARCAFIATSLLRSMLTRGVISADDYHRYLNGIDTVASALMADLERLRFGDLALDDFLVEYGHLRPGTYDIRAQSYADRPEEYLTLSGAPTGSTVVEQKPEPQHVDLHLGDVTDRGSLLELIGELGFEFDIDQLDEFIKSSIRDREWLKFEFTKNLSAALDAIARFGRHHGLGRDDLAYIDIDTFLRFANQSLSDEDVAGLRAEIERSRKTYELTSSIPLPDLIFSPRDAEVISNQRRKPNFVTQRTVVAQTVHLAHASEIPSDDDLRGRIVLIENADPGFDWLFSKDIGGLCTKYGGAASHMTIRCSEFGTPAAIGCGEQIFAELTRARTVRLNCLQQQVEPHET